MANTRNDSGLVWCHCHSMVREGGMCSEGFCNPEILREDSKQDRPLIDGYRHENNPPTPHGYSGVTV